MQEEKETRFINTSDIQDESCLTHARQRLTICFNWLLCGCFSSQDNAQVYPEGHTNQDFWTGFEMAFSALKNPIILGELEKGTYDVKVTYINQAAERFTGYQNVIYNEDRPLGIIGRSVTTLMPSHHAQNHAAYVKHWVHNTNSSLSFDKNNHSRTNRATDTEYKSVEKIRRHVEVLTSQDNIVQTYATLSFFTAKGRGKRVVGIFSIEELPELPNFSLQNITIKMRYKKDGERNFTHVIVTPPTYPSEFTDDSKWQFQQIGGKTSKMIREKCKTIICQQINQKLCEIATTNNLQLTLLNSDNTLLNKATRSSIHDTLIELINSDRSADNMYMYIRPFIDREVEEQEGIIINHTPSFC